MRITRALAAAAAVVAGSGLAVVPAALAATASAAAPTTYYFSPLGQDTNSGTSAAAPKRSIAAIATLPLKPGDSVRLKAGSTFLGLDGLTLNASGTRTAPITLGSYGTGKPAAVRLSAGACITVNGSFVNVTTLAASGCQWAAFGVAGDNVNLDRVDASGSYAGVQFEESATYGSVTNSTIHDNKVMKLLALGADDDSGAFGVLVLGDHTLVRDNTISGQDTFSADYGRDGAAVEVFGATSTTVERNVVKDNQTFVEVGGIPRSNEVSGVNLTGNTISASAPTTYGVVVHAGDAFGAASGVRVVRNAIALTGSGSVGVVCGPRCTPSVLALVANKITAAGGATSVEGTYGTR